MRNSGNTILVTGGATGIGFALAERFLRNGNEVILCGRREKKLQEARERTPGFHTIQADVATASGREELVRRVTEGFPAVNVLVNNAGVQRRVDLTTPEPWHVAASEIAINLEAPIHLSTLFIPHLQRCAAAAIINVTSGLSFLPLASVPIYSATKAALHSFTLSLRHQLAGTPIEVIEVAPPAVNTDLGGPGLHTFGIPVDVFADGVMSGLGEGSQEITYGFSTKASRASREELDAMFGELNSMKW